MASIDNSLPAANAEIPSISTWRTLGLMATFGSVGGLAYWLLTLWSGTPLPAAFGHWAFLVLMFLGALSGLIGVYLLTASDTSAIRTYVFAAICGIVWQPVIAAGVRIAVNVTATNQTAQIGTQLEQVQAAVNGGNVQQLNTAVQQTVPAVTQALNFTGSVDDTVKKNEIINTSKQAISQLQSTAAKAPSASVEALKTISITAAQSGTPSVALNAIEALNAIASKTKSPEVAENVRQSLTIVANQAADSSVKIAAKSAVLQIKPQQ